MCPTTAAIQIALNGNAASMIQQPPDIAPPVPRVRVLAKVYPFRATKDPGAWPGFGGGGMTSLNLAKEQVPEVPDRPAG